MMEQRKKWEDNIRSLKNGDHYYFNMAEGGGAVCYECNGMYLLFEVPVYGGEERYEGTYNSNNIDGLINEALRWT